MLLLIEQDRLLKEMKIIISKVTLFLTAMCFFSVTVNAQIFEERKRSWQVDGGVRALEYDSINGIVYYGGNFDWAGVHNSFSALVDTSFVYPKNSFPLPSEILPNARAIGTVERDNNGGWFIGGSFYKIQDSPIKYFANVDSLGNVSSTEFEFNGEVKNLKRQDDLLFVMGKFTKVNGERRRGFAAIDLSENTLLDWDPDIFEGVSDAVIADSILVLNSCELIGNWVNGGAPINIENQEVRVFPDIESVTCVIPDNQGGWYISGGFTSVDDSLRDGLAHVDHSGVVTGFNHSVDGPINEIEMRTDTLYLAGDFNLVDGQGRNNLAAIDLNTDSLTALSQEFNAPVKAIQVTPDSIIVGGEFTRIEEFSTGGIAQTNNDQIDTILGYNEMELEFGDRPIFVSDESGGWYVFSDFDSIAGQPRNGTAHINQNGVLTGWQSNVQPSIYLQDVELVGDLIFLAGNGTDGNNYYSELYAIDKTSGIYQDIDFPFGEQFGVRQIESKGDTLFLAGGFNIDGQVHSLIAYSISNNEVIELSDPPEDDIYSLTQGNGYLFAMGNFEEYLSGEPAQFFAKYNIQTLENEYSNVVLQDWAYGMTYLNGNVYLIKNYLDSVNYTQVGSITAISSENDILLDFNIEGLSVSNNQTRIFSSEEYIYLTGINSGISRRYHWLTGEMDSLWIPPEGFDLYAVQSNNVVGHIAPFGGTPSLRLCSLNKTGEILSTNLSPFSRPIQFVQNEEYTCALMDSYSSLSNEKVVIIDHNEPSIPTEIDFGVSLHYIEIYGDKLLLAGQFTEILGVETKSLAQYDLSTGQLEATPYLSQLDFDLSYPKIADIEISGDTLFLAGSLALEGYGLDTINPVGVMAFDINSGNLLDWKSPIATANFGVDGISLQDSLMFINRSLPLHIMAVGGEPCEGLAFYNVNSEEFVDYSFPVVNNGSILAIKDSLLITNISGITAYNTKDSFAEVWNLQAYPNQLEVYGDTLIFCNKDWIDESQNKRWVAAVDITTGNYLDWNPLWPDTEFTSGELYHMEVFDDQLVIASKFYGNGWDGRLFEIDIPTGDLLKLSTPVDYSAPFNIADPIWGLSRNENGLMILGAYKSIGGVRVRDFLAKDISTGLPLDVPIVNTSSSSGGAIEHLVMHGDSLYITGSFDSINGESRDRFFSVNRFNGELGLWTPNFSLENQDQIMYSSDVPLIGKIGDNLLISWAIGNAFGEYRDNTTLIDLNTFELNSFNSDVYAYSYTTLDDKLFLGGRFSEAQGEVREGVAAYSIESGDLTEWQIHGAVLEPYFRPELDANDTTIFVREYFQNEDPNIQTGVSAVSPIDGQGQAWFSDQNAAAGIGPMHLWDDLLFAGNYSNDRLLIYNIAQGFLLPWNEHSNDLGEILVRDSILFVGSTIYDIANCPFEILCSDTTIALTEQGMILDPINLVDFDSFCGETPSLVTNSQFYNCSALGVNTLDVVATDANGQLATCTSQITLIDTIAPQIECANITVGLNESGSYQLDPVEVVIGAPSPCGIQSYNLLSGQTEFDCSDFPGSYLIQVEVFDSSGNASTCSGSVTLVQVDYDNDGIDDACDECFGDNSTGDLDGDGICGNMEISGCQNPSSPNYNPFATDPGPCQISDESEIYDFQLSEIQINGFYPEEDHSLLGLTQFNSEERDILYPNPLTSEQKIHLRLARDADIDIAYILNMQGVIIRREVPEILDANTFSLQNNLTPGTYIIKINTDDEIKYFKLIVQ